MQAFLLDSDDFRAVVRCSVERLEVSGGFLFNILVCRLARLPIVFLLEQI